MLTESGVAVIENELKTSKFVSQALVLMNQGGLEPVAYSALTVTLAKVAYATICT